VETIYIMEPMQYSLNNDIDNNTYCISNVLFLNHKIHNCGVYQYGLRLYNILKNTDTINYIYKEIDCLDEYIRVVSDTKNISGIIYNYHMSTMPWLNINTIIRNAKNIGIPHEVVQEILTPGYLFDIICNIDPNESKNDLTIFSIPRPLFENVDDMLVNCPVGSESINTFINIYTDTDIPIFGSFGFGFDNKGFNKIISLVNSSYDNAIIKFVIPTAHFDPVNNRVDIMCNICMNVPRKDGIKLLITHEFLSNEDILRFLKSNTMNIFMYDYMFRRGISSTIDYALSVKKPLAISDSYMFRNIYSDIICLYKTSIKDCMANSTEYCSKFLELYSSKSIINIFKLIVMTSKT
jgi:hypothetical protein